MELPKSKSVPITHILPETIRDIYPVPNSQGTGLIPISDITKDTVMVNFGSRDGKTLGDHLELHIYNPIGELLESAYDIPYDVIHGIADSSNTNLNNVVIDLHQIFRDLGYISGKFDFVLNFHRKVLGTDNSRASITSISIDRTEVVLSYKGPSNLETSPLIDDFGNRLEYFLNFGNNKLVRIATFTKNIDLSTADDNVFTITLQSPLIDDIGLGTELWIDLQSADTRTDSIIILPVDVPENLNVLRGPNFSISTTNGFAQSTAFKSWDDILGSNPTSSQQLINKFISSSFDSIELPIDYKDYTNFVFYGSAVDRLSNFEYKLKLIEYYDQLISASSTIANPSIATNKAELESKRNTIITGFDGYENYLYFQSSSYESSSFGEYNPSTWPKSNSSKPYVLYSVTSSEATEWYESQLHSASIYDNKNDNALVRLIPEHILVDSFNESYSTFVNMIGQHFDILWSYVKHLNSVNSRKESISEGLAKDLIYHILSSFGIDVVNGFNIEELWLDALALNVSGSYTQIGDLHSISNSDISKETWKRILNNLPFLLKTKGTRRGIRALINCYGVPDTVYRINEFSGPYEYSSDAVSLGNQYSKVQKYNQAVFFNGDPNAIGDNIYINSSFTGHTALEFRILPEKYNTDATQSIIFSIFGDYIVYITENLDTASYGTIGISGDGVTSDTITGPFFNGGWWHVTVPDSDAPGTRYLRALQACDGRIAHHISASISTTYAEPVVVSIGGTNNGLFFATHNYYGKIQEVRLWATASLDVDTLVAHTLNPQSVVGNNTVSTITSQNPESYDYTTAASELVLRLPLGSTLQDSETDLALNKNFATNVTQTGTSYISMSSNYEDYYVWAPNLGDNLNVSDKIRIESAKLDGQLNTQHSVEVSQYDTFGLDSPKVGVYFSPQDEINEDISDQFSGLLLDDFIGDPRDDFKGQYTELQALRTHYNLKYTDRNQFWKYIRLIENFDASMFYLIKKMLPARSTKLVGLVIQPTLLERSKVPHRTIVAQNELLETELSQLPTDILGEYVTHEANTILINNTLNGEYLSYLPTADVLINTQLIGDVNYQSGIIQIDIANISSNVTYVNDNTETRFFPIGKFNHTYKGCKISSRGVNIPSDDTFDNSPVIEIWDTNPNTPVNLRSNTGQISTNTNLNRKTPGISRSGDKKP